MIEFKRTELELKIYGKEYRVRYPKVSEFQSYSSKAANVEAEKQFDLTRDFLVKLGLDDEIVGELELAHLKRIVATVSGAGKK